MTGRERFEKILKIKNQMWEERASEVRPGDILEFTGPFGLGRIAGEESLMFREIFANGLTAIVGRYLDKGDKFIVLEDITITKSLGGIKFRNNLRLKCLSLKTNAVGDIRITENAWMCTRRKYDELIKRYGDIIDLQLIEKYGDEVGLQLIPIEDSLWIKGLNGKISEVFIIHRK